jgi:hypothetical protein
LREIEPVFLVTPASAYVVATLPRQSGILSQKFGYGGVLAEQIPGPRQLFQALQFDSTLDEPAGGKRIAFGDPLGANALAEVFVLMTGHRHTSFWKQCRL